VALQQGVISATPEAVGGDAMDVIDEQNDETVNIQ
jgi:hypothetical protein